MARHQKSHDFQVQVCSEPLCLARVGGVTCSAIPVIHASPQQGPPAPGSMFSQTFFFPWSCGVEFTKTMWVLASLHLNKREALVDTLFPWCRMRKESKTFLFAKFLGHPFKTVLCQTCTQDMSQVAVFSPIQTRNNTFRVPWQSNLSKQMFFWTKFALLSSPWKIEIFRQLWICHSTRLKWS